MADVAARPVTDVPDGEGPLRNRLLAALPASDLARLRPHLELVELQQRELLYDPETSIRHVYFPETAVVSLVSMLRDGGTVEVGTAGREGMAGLPVFLGDDTSTLQAFAQIAGLTVRMEKEAFLRLAGERGELQRTLLRYTQAFLTQVAQTAACNGAHLVEERCARWLLMTHDRVDGDSFELTHEFLAFMLGVRRAGVSVAMRTLQNDGLVRYNRGRVTIVDRHGLEGASCECYEVVRAHFDRLLPPSLVADDGDEAGESD
jgi:CRP-like cAMP-binding protein